MYVEYTVIHLRLMYQAHCASVLDCTANGMTVLRLCVVCPQFGQRVCYCKFHIRIGFYPWALVLGQLHKTKYVRHLLSLWIYALKHLAA